MKIEELTHYELFRALVNYLWIRYDLGGISIGRSYQSSLLEGFMDLFPFAGWRDLEGDIRQDVQRRILLAPREWPDLQEVLPFSEIEVLTDQKFTLLALTEMCRWHREEAEAAGFHRIEHRWVTVQIRIMCELSFPRISHKKISSIKWTKQSLMEEGHRRRRVLYNAEQRIEWFTQSGINPWNQT